MSQFSRTIPFNNHQPVVSLEKIEAMRREIAHLFAVSDTTLDVPFKGAARFRGRFLVDSADCFDELRAIFEAYGFTPFVRDEDGRIAIIAEPGVHIAEPSNWYVNLILFLVTIMATLVTGAFYEARSVDEIWNFWNGWPFALSIMLILGAHEMGHYVMARYHKVPVTLPYFIPLPIISPIGTMGAVIRIKGPIQNRRALHDIGVAGPLVGLVFAIPILLYGLATSDVGPISATGMLEGNSLMYAGAKLLVFGQFLPSATQDVYLNQVAWAGWVGLLVTAMNLMPLGQLDGGHVTYTLLGNKAKKLFAPIMAGLIGLAVFSFLVDNTLTWVLWIFLLFFLGRIHAEPLDDVTPLDKKRRWIAVFTLFMFVLVFVPVPFRILG
jgi:membrane-associated protease RseP (regulator of RpoE activity)